MKLNNPQNTENRSAPMIIGNQEKQNQQLDNSLTSPNLNPLKVESWVYVEDLNDTHMPDNFTDISATATASSASAAAEADSMEVEIHTTNWDPDSEIDNKEIQLLRDQAQASNEAARIAAEKSDHYQTMTDAHIHQKASQDAKPMTEKLILIEE